jgi:adenosylcobinamide kinase/adenosylcobinamide-phosphate guanylyltransferase
MSAALPRHGVTLVLGGARSGKSAFAERLVRDSGLARAYVATATAGDDEMAARIAHHRDARGTGWRTIEEPLTIAQAIEREAAADRAVLVDCLTLWLSNLLETGRDIAAETAKLTAALCGAPHGRGLVVLVSNEIGMGLVPDTPLGRAFRDAQGRLNQTVAQAADNVAFVAAGLPLWLKRFPATTTETASS